MPKKNLQKNDFTRHQIRHEIKADPVAPADWQNLEIIFCCEQCSHFDGEQEKCTIGYNAANHLRKTNLSLYEKTGRVAFCRYQEID